MEDAGLAIVSAAALLISVVITFRSSRESEAFDRKHEVERH